ncbi:hypothetical protein P7L79_22305 [Tistrella mobilis]|uniref:hypothetical protein n=1 Tax=Tistrella mobilis TaxID=171437 RepID=UPI00355814A1
MEGSPRMLLPCPLTPLAVEVWELRDDLPDNPFDQYEVRQLIAPDEQEAEEVALGLLTVFADMSIDEVESLQLDWLASGMSGMVPTAGGFLGLRAVIYAMQVAGIGREDLAPVRDYIRAFNELCLRRWRADGREADALTLAAWLEQFDQHWAVFLEAWQAAHAPDATDAEDAPDQAAPDADGRGEPGDDPAG